MTSTSCASGYGLTDLPNIRFVLTEALTRAGITAAAELNHVGAEIAWMRVGSADLHDDTQLLPILNGAVQGVSWRNVPTERRRVLLGLADCQRLLSIGSAK